jgi:hypothetical protein
MALMVKKTGGSLGLTGESSSKFTKPDSGSRWLDDKKDPGNHPFYPISF